jgi:hypothetical protein
MRKLVFLVVILSTLAWAGSAIAVDCDDVNKRYERLQNIAKQMNTELQDNPGDIESMTILRNVESELITMINDCGGFTKEISEWQALGECIGSFGNCERWKKKEKSWRDDRYQYLDTPTGKHWAYLYDGEVSWYAGYLEKHWCTGDYKERYANSSYSVGNGDWYWNDTYNECVKICEEDEWWSRKKQRCKEK